MEASATLDHIPGTPLLFTPIKFRDVECKNRIFVSPMCQYSCREKSGIVNEWHFVHLGSRAVGGAGLVMAEATAVTKEGRISPADSGLWNDEQAKVNSCRRFGALLVSCMYGKHAITSCIQCCMLINAGNQLSPGMQPASNCIHTCHLLSPSQP